MVYGYGKKAYEQFLSYILDPEYGDITDEETGTDIKLTYTKPTKPGAFPQTTLKMSRHSSALHENGDRIFAIMDTMPDFSKLWERKTPDEIDAILDEQMGSDANASNQSRETHHYGGNSGNSIDKAYDDLKDLPF